jgi:hypothetical protein
MSKIEDFRGETVHNYIGILSEIILDIDHRVEIEKVDRDLIGILLSDVISILNDY